MRAFGLAIASLTLVIAASAVPLSNEKNHLDLPVFADYKPGDKCPAEHFSDGCNICVCTLGSNFAACTKMACPKIEKRSVQNDDIPVFSDYKPGDKCPAEHFSDGCNYCVCTLGSNFAACTKMACPKIEKRSVQNDDIPVFSDYKPGDKCPAEHFSDGCNYCVCNKETNAVFCTLRLCPELENKRVTRSVDLPVFSDYKPGDKCPAEHFSDGCNYCVCNKETNAVFCTLRLCPELENKRVARSTELSAELPVFSDYKPGDKCPAEHFSDGCNYCICDTKTNFVLCTLKLCPELENNKRVARSAELPVFSDYKFGDKCPAEHFFDGCNYCKCDLESNVAACTLKLCPELEKKRAVRSVDVPIFSNYKPGDKCPAEHFFDGCNYCSCKLGSRLAACTLKYCPEEEKQSYADSFDLPVYSDYKPGDECPAEHFFDGCNYCSCKLGSNLVACTLKYCPEEEKKRTARSVDLPVFSDYKFGDKCPAERFSDGCNICFCKLGDTMAACTKMACPPKEHKN